MSVFPYPETWTFCSVPEHQRRTALFAGEENFVCRTAAERSAVPHKASRDAAEPFL